MLQALTFLGLWALVYAVLLLVYFTVGWALLRINRRYPERQIHGLNGRDRRPRMSAGEEIRQSLKALAATAFCTAGGLYMQHLGWTQTPLAMTPVSLLWTFAVAVVLQDAWLYFQHRLMHMKPLYRRFHRRHHLSVAPSVWSNNAFTVTDAFLIQAFFLVLPFILPIPPLALIGMRLFDEVRGLIGHAGHEHFAGRLARAPWPFIAVLHHEQHHQYFDVNFGNQFSFWDRICGTLHPSYDRLVMALEKGVAPADLRAEPAKSAEHSA